MPAAYEDCDATGHLDQKRAGFHRERGMNRCNSPYNFTLARIGRRIPFSAQP